MFSNLSERLTGIVKDLRGRARLTEENIDSTLREVRMALLEGDVASLDHPPSSSSLGCSNSRA